MPSRGTTVSPWRSPGRGKGSDGRMERCLAGQQVGQQSEERWSGVAGGGGVSSADGAQPIQAETGRRLTVPSSSPNRMTERIV